MVVQVKLVCREKLTLSIATSKKTGQIMFYKRDLLIFPNGTLLIKFR